MPLTFISGPVRSGKSAFAEALAARKGLPVAYVATARADANDPEWVERLAFHAARRPPAWALIETAAPRGRDLAEVALAASAAGVLIVDSLGTWLADRMSASLEGVPEGSRVDACALEEEARLLADALTASPAHIVAVSEEVGWGIVPEHPSGRLFRDVLGRLNRRLAQAAERAYLVVNGFALPLNDLAAARLDSACACGALREDGEGARKPIVSL
jgi:adenosylcobinamide kinase/adenosylcobinamide-phosphate guanylyltransferase